MIPLGALMRKRGEETNEETAGWIEEEDVEKLDSLLAALEEGADCQRVWSNIDGWPS
jgi:transcriptional/translational regulatory protein YebC/TACO1